MLCLIHMHLSSGVKTNMLHTYTSSTLKICTNLKSTAQLAYIVTHTDAYSDYGRLFQCFYNVSQCFYDVPYSSYFDYGLYSHWYGICIEVFWLLVAKDFIC